MCECGEDAGPGVCLCIHQSLEKAKLCLFLTQLLCNQSSIYCFASLWWDFLKRDLKHGESH